MIDFEQARVVDKEFSPKLNCNLRERSNSYLLEYDGGCSIQITRKKYEKNNSGFAD